jgi:hypothetical protein
MEIAGKAFLNSSPVRSMRAVIKQNTSSHEKNPMTVGDMPKRQ